MNYVIVYLKTCHLAADKWLFAGDAAIGTKAPFVLAKRFSIQQAELYMNSLQPMVWPDVIGIINVNVFEVYK